ncbi:hypothetical protein L0F63_005688 [Massospora cicadina]|nr:hypothetical protein L0F63_005688 [Massospora cicadina]
MHCLRGGMSDAKCTTNCPPCWKKTGSVFNCFEYNSSGECNFDWVDVGRGADPNGKPSTKIAPSSESTTQVPTTSGEIQTVSQNSSEPTAATTSEEIDTVTQSLSQPTGATTKEGTNQSPTTSTPAVAA